MRPAIVTLSFTCALAACPEPTNQRPNGASGEQNPAAPGASADAAAASQIVGRGGGDVAASGDVARTSSPDAGEPPSAVDLRPADALVDPRFRDSGGIVPAGDALSRPPTFSSVLDILRLRCAGANSCHSVMAAGGFQVGDGIKGPNPAGAYMNLLADATSAACKGQGKRIVPGNPAASVIVQKIDWTTPPRCGPQMPDGSLVPIKEGDINTIKAWIAAGAKMD